MTEETNGKATIKEVYEAVNALRDELNAQFARLQAELTSSFASRDACRTRHEALDAATALRLERMEKLETAVEEQKALIYKAVGAGAVIAAVVSFAADRIFR